jgi:hypothetical protein
MRRVADLSTHQISRTDFRAHARGLGGPEAVGRLATAECSKHILLIRAVVERAGDGPGAREAFGRLAQAQRHAPDEVMRLLARPDVGAWATDCLRGLMHDDHDPRQHHLQALAELPKPGGRPCRTEHAGLTLDVALDHENPYLDRYRYARERVPNLQEWQSRIAAAWRILCEGHRHQAEEIARGIQTIVPLASAPGAHVNSATSAAAFGAVATSLPPDGTTLAETLVHEFQHVKLCALLDLIPLAEPDGGSTYYAPWRNDPRPLLGLLHGAYAYLGVTRFWRTQRFAGADPRGHVEFARRRAEALEVTGTLLESAGLTEEGAEFVGIMREQLSVWRDDEIPAWAVRLAAELSTAHRARWDAR